MTEQETLARVERIIKGFELFAAFLVASSGVKDQIPRTASAWKPLPSEGFDLLSAVRRKRGPDSRRRT